MSKPTDKPHDQFFSNIFSLLPVAKDLIAQFLSAEDVEKLDLETLALQPTTFVNTFLEKKISDLVFSCRIKGTREEVFISLIKEHKSSRPRYPHFQLLDYIVEKWRKERKARKRPTPVICILLYHGKNKWHYKGMSHYIKGIDEGLAKYNPLFDFVLIDLNKYSDDFILNLKAGFLINALLVLKHSGDEEYILRKFNTLVFRAEKMIYDETGNSILRTIFVYITKTTMISTEKLEKMIEKVPAIKKEFISGWDMSIAEAEKKGIEKGIEKGLSIKELAIIRNGWTKGLAPEFIAEIGDIDIKKVKTEIAKLETEKRKKGKIGTPKNKRN